MTDTNFSYVRKDMIPEQEPPVAERGVIKWLRENLFSSWLNILLTVVSLAVIYWAFALVLPWAFGGVWNAGSLTECREVLFSFYKDSHDGACWAVIEDRWLQIMFGFYPPEEYWRPILAFVLFFVALAPVLFADKVPGQLIWFTLAYPFVATWLIWGGSIWGPLLTALGFVVAFVAYKIVSKLSGPIVSNLAALAAALIWWAIAMTPINDAMHRMVGEGRLASTVASLQARGETLPAELEALETAGDAQAETIAAAVAEKDATLAEIVEIRIEEVAVAAQIERKEDALQRLDGAAENVVKLSELLADWGGAPAAAQGATEAEAAEAAAANEEASDLAGDIASFVAGALSDIEGNTAEPSEVANLMVSAAASEDPSILEDIDTMVAKAELTAPLSALVSATEGLSVDVSQDELATIGADIGTAMAALSANIASLKEIESKVIATNADDLAEPQARLLEQMANLTALRDDATVIAQETFRVSSEQSDNRGFLNALNSLEDREASLDGLRADVETTGAELTRSQRAMISVGQLPEGTSSDVVAAVDAHINAKNTLASVQASIRETYGELGRVGLTPIDSRQIGGFMLALIIGIAGIVLSLPLGVLLALGRQSHLFIVNKVCVAFIEIIRGVPLIVWLFTASLLLNYFLPPGSNFDLMLRVIIMVTLFSSAYIAEVIRGGLAALPTGQYEGADSLGLGYWQSMQLIILPQAMKISIPGIVNSFIGLFKDTTLVVFIGLLDPIGLSNAIRADTDWNGVYWELFVFIGLLFFIFCFSMGRYSLFLEKKLQREHR